jgi:alkanesulfonate monooxygenase SsuD/methylene tetrahydromethanopterin reductase-like flavin-dependent oxidoreductase (luciferase family)
MTDYGHDLQFGAFITPVAEPAPRAVELAFVAERAGLDLVSFQDHPYQPAYLDTWTLLSYVASRTTRVHLSGNVLNLPLRPPAVLARAAASLDRLSGGRLELGIGSGAFLEGVAAMGGKRLTAAQAVNALEEGIHIIRDVWAVERRGGVNVDGTHYQVKGARRGPAPAHDIGIWIGAYKRRMLELTGRLGDGWLPSLVYVDGGVAGLAEANRVIDDSALAAGRTPTAIRRLLNINGQFRASRGGLLDGPPAQWAEELADLTLQHGISAFIVWSDDAPSIELFAAEVAPRTRELVAAARGQLTAPAEATTRRQ